MKRWVAYERQRGRHNRPLFVVEAETEKEALCLASDAALHRQTPTAAASGKPRVPWRGPMVHVRPAEDVPEADVVHAERRLSSCN